MSKLQPISDQEIAWACDLMGLPAGAFAPIDGDNSRMDAIKNLGTADYEACPGSGKTTLLVAKLAIMAGQWNSRRQGICVLSHTNAARDEISARLSSSASGAALLRYPHFIGTIHAFANEFLALPWLRSKGNPIKAIDTEIALTKRWFGLEWNTRNYLEKQRLDKYALAYTQADYAGGEKGTIGTHTDTYKAMVAQSKSVSELGYFCYDEMFVWANEILDTCPWVVKSLRQRFPFIFVDEAQDNSELQSALLSKVFCDGSDPSTRQRFGDSNQAIYQHAGGSGATTDVFPNLPKFDLPRSYRFGQEIADQIRALGVNPQALVGAGPASSHIKAAAKQSTIFLFDDDSVGLVLSKYAELLLASFTETELVLGTYTAVAGVHEMDKSANLPRAMGHYAPRYDPASLRKEVALETFSQFLDRARFRMGSHADVHHLVNGTAEAILHLVSLLGGESTLRRGSAHRRVRELLEGKNELASYESLIARVIACRGDLSNEWSGAARDMASGAAHAIGGTVTQNERSKIFLDWRSPIPAEGDHTSSRTNNLFAYPVVQPRVHIRLGSIHSVKGETHTATLVLESFFYDHHFKTLKPWLLGKKVGGVSGSKAENDRTLGRLRLHYVAMSRPTHLLCVAMRRDSLDAGELATLHERGWNTVNVLN